MATQTANVFKLSTNKGGAEHTNLYRWSGERHLSGLCGGIESFVRDAGTRAIIGRWLPCPNAGVNIALQRRLESAA